MTHARSNPSLMTCYNHEPLPERARRVLEFLTASRLKENATLEVPLSVLQARLDLSRWDVVYGLGKLLLAGIIRFRLVKDDEWLLQVVLKGRDATSSAMILRNSYSKETGRSTGIKIFNRSADTGRNDRGKEKGVEGEKEREISGSDLAQALGEPELAAYYEKLTKTYPVHLVLKALKATLAFPAERIQKSRAALFKHTLDQYAKRHK